MASPLIIEEPALIIGGVQKGGTTTVFNQLATHPAFSPAKIKESHFFAQTDKLIEKEFTWYRSLYTENGIRLDASTSYFSNPSIPPRLNKYFKAPKAVLLIRDPIERVHSGFLQTAKVIPTLESRNLIEIAKLLSNTKQENHFAEEQKLINTALREGTLSRTFFQPDHYQVRGQASFQAEFEDPAWVHRYIWESRYDVHLPRWREAFGDRLFIGTFEDFVSRPTELFAALFKFLDLDFDPSFFDFGNRANTTALIQSEKTKKLATLNAYISRGRLGSWKRKVLNPLFKGAYRSIIRRDATERPQIPAELSCIEPLLSQAKSLHTTTRLP